MPETLAPTPTPTPSAEAPPPAPAPAPSLEAPARPSLDEDLGAMMSKSTSPTPRQPAGKPPSLEGDEEPDEEVVPPPVTPPPDEGAEEDFLTGTKKAPPTPPPVPSEPEQGPAKAPELRKAYLEKKARVAALEKELAVFKSKPAEESEKQNFTTQIAELQKQLQEREAVIQSAVYEQSPAYKDKFERPFIEAWNEGVAQVESLKVTDEAGNVRAGTADDFQAVMRETNHERAAALATEMFGTNAFYVLAQRRDLQRLNAERNRVINEHRTSFGERTKVEQAAALKQREEQEAAQIQNTNRFKTLTQQTVEKYPEFFAPEPGDDEGNSVLAKGIADADLAFEGAPGLTPEQRIQLHSKIRNRAAGFGRLVHRLKGKDARITQLEAELKEFRGSAPGPGRVAGEAEKVELSAEQEFEALAKRR